MFHQVLNPTGSMFATWLLALVPVLTLLVLLAVFRITAWLSVLIGSVVTYLLGVWVWHMPVGDGILSYLYGSATGVWAVDWITFWGVAIFNTLIVTGAFERFRKWLVYQGTADVRVQTILFAWAFGALLEGLVGFGYPWAFVAPILITLGIPDLDAIRVAAIANNAPVSYGALGVPIIALAAVTGLPLLTLSGAVGHIVAVLALLPPWVLLYLVSGWQGMVEAWPLAIVGSVAYIAGQFPVAVFLGPYLPDVAGSIVCFVALLLLLKVWRPKIVRGYGGEPLSAEQQAASVAMTNNTFSASEVLWVWMPFFLLIIIVVLWTGPWSPLPSYVPFKLAVSAGSSLEKGAAVTTAFAWAPAIGGTSIAASWIAISLLFRVNGSQIKEIFRKTWHQMWGACRVGFFIFGRAFNFNYSGMAGSLAYGFSRIGVWFVLLAPVLGWIGVALSGSNTSTNAMFGWFQLTVGRILGLPPVLLPSLNSVGAEIGKPVAPQTASVGVSTSRFVRNEGEVIRHNFGWTLVLLLYLMLVGGGFYLFAPNVLLVHGW